MDAGKGQKQALAIAYNVMRKNRAKKMASGGDVPSAETPQDMDEADRAGADVTLTRRVTDHYAPASEDLPENMASGGMAMHPMKIAENIRMKRMADGGEVADDPNSAVSKFTKGFKGVFAEGGMVGDMDDESEDSNSEAESLPFEDEDKVDIPPLGYDSAREDTEGMHDRKNRRGMLSAIMRKSRP